MEEQAEHLEQTKPVKHAENQTRYKTYYVSSAVFDVRKLSFSIKFYNDSDAETEKTPHRSNLLSLVKKYEYDEGLVSKLNILHEDARMYSASVPKFAMRDGKLEQHARLTAPIHYDKDDQNSMLLKNVLDAVLEAQVQFLYDLGQADLEVLIEKYVWPSVCTHAGCTDHALCNRKISVLTALHKKLQKMTFKDIDKSFQPRTRHHDLYDPNDPDDAVNNHDTHNKRDKFFLVPKICRTTEIIKLGSKKDAYQNKTMQMGDFYDSISKIYKMNDKDSELFYQCTMIINIPSFYIADANIISFTPICSKFEYKINKAACRRVIKKKKIEQPLIIQRLVV